MPRYPFLVVTAVFALSAVVGCGGSESPASSSSPSVSNSAETSAPMTPLHGSWRLDLTEEAMAATLEAAGYGDLAEQLFVAEDIEGSITQVLTVEGDRFAIAYQSGSQPWQVGWQGPATVSGDSVSLHDDKFVTTDTLRWAVNGDELTLEIVDADDAVLKGLPNEMYLIAYFTSAPFQRTDCVPTEDDCEN